MLDVNKATALALLQDFGRYGHQNIGLSNSGPMDEKAFLWANKLLQNNYNASAIEISYGGFNATFQKATQISICGADLQTQINGVRIKNWSSHHIQAGDTINFIAPKYGLRSYLAVKDGFQIPKVLSSCATVERENIGGLCGRGNKIVAQNRVPYLEYKSRAVNFYVPDRYRHHPESPVILHYLPNHNVGSHNAFQQLERSCYSVGTLSNRMGYRLEGAAIKTNSDSMLSQGTVLGAIQIPLDGQPIILMRDRQTIGGYPVIGCISYLDTNKLAQCKPADTVQFVAMGLEKASKELRQHLQFFAIAQPATAIKDVDGNS